MTIRERDTMNTAQAKSIVRVLQDASHPRTDPVTAQFYTPDEYADFGEPTVDVVRHHDARDDDPETMEVVLSVGWASRDRELHLTANGTILAWSTVRIPPEDCDCECPGPPTSKVDRSSCPVHGDGVREIECFRAVKSVGWEIVNRGTPTWLLVVREGDPIRDVLGEYRAERAKVATR